MHDVELLKGGLKARLPRRQTGLGHFPAQKILGMNGMRIWEARERGTGARFEIPGPRGGFRMKEGFGGRHGNARIQA